MIRIEGFIVNRDLLGTLRNTTVRLFVPTCMLFSRDVERLLAHRKVASVAPLITLDEAQLLIPNRLKALSDLARSGVRDICIVAPSVESISESIRVLEMLSKIFDVYTIVLSSERIEESQTMSRICSKLRVFLPLANESLSLVRLYNIGIVISLRLYSREKRSLVKVDPKIVEHSIRELKELGRSAHIIIDILDIGSHRGSL